MRSPKGSGLTLALIGAVFPGSYTCAQISTTEGHEVLDTFWPELNVFVKMNDATRIFLLYAGTRTLERGNTDGQAGIHLDFFSRPIFKGRIERNPDIPRNRFLMLRVGYLFGRTPPDSPDRFVEHMPTIELTTRLAAGKYFILGDRNRADFRIVDGVYTPRYRNRLKAERTFNIRNWDLTPYAYAEAFYDWRYDVFHRFRFAAEAEWEIWDHFVLEGYYLRQIDTRSPERHTNVLGIVGQFYFR